jgi:hypothetical protein
LYGIQKFSDKRGVPLLAVIQESYIAHSSTTPVNMSNEASGSTSAAHASVLTPSEALPADAVRVGGPDFNEPIDLFGLLGGYERIGFQATGLARAIQVIEKMASQLQRLWHVFVGNVADIVA